MRALGRILQIAGWLLFVGAIAGSILGDDRLSVFPGLILIFFARVLRAQRARTETSEPQGQKPEPEVAAPDRILNTERSQQASTPPSRPQATYTPPAPATEPVQDVPEEPERTPEERDDLLERIVAAGREAADQPESAEVMPLDTEPEGPRPMSSEEMIARAHRRWDTKDR